MANYHNPMITEVDDKIIILGDSENLRALGEALIMKSKMGRNMSCVITDSCNKPIEIMHQEDLVGEANK